MSYEDVPPYHPLSELFGDYDKLAHEISSSDSSTIEQETCRRFIHFVRKDLDRLLVAPCSEKAEADIVDKLREICPDYSDSALDSIRNFARVRLIEDNRVSGTGPDPFQMTAAL